MSTTDKNTLLGWFVRGAKPLATQFAAWIESYYHKDDKIPVSAIEGLQAEFDKKADNDSVSTEATARANADSSLLAVIDASKSPYFVYDEPSQEVQMLDPNMAIAFVADGWSRSVKYSNGTPAIQVSDDDETTMNPSYIRFFSRSGPEFLTLSGPEWAGYGRCTEDHNGIVNFLDLGYNDDGQNLSGVNTHSPEWHYGYEKHSGLEDHSGDENHAGSENHYGAENHYGYENHTGDEVHNGSEMHMGINSFQEEADFYSSANFYNDSEFYSNCFFDRGIILPGITPPVTAEDGNMIFTGTDLKIRINGVWKTIQMV